MTTIAKVEPAAASDRPDRPRRGLALDGESTPARLLLADVARSWRLLPMLARQDYAARYRSAALGLLWSVFLPLLQGAVLAVVFTQVVRVDTGGQNYAVFVLVGMNAWAYVNSSWSMGSTAIVDGSAIASRVYFPRLLLPAIAPGANLPGFAVANGVALVAMIALGVPVKPTLLLLPVAMALAAVLVVLLSAVTSLLHVYYRDTRYIISATLIVLFYATPVIYPMSLVPAALEPAVLLNPVTGVVQLSRFAVFGSADSLVAALGGTVIWLVALLILTVKAYSRHERVAVDRL